MSLEADALGFDADVPTDVGSLQRQILGSVEDYLKSLVTRSEPSRFGWRAFFLTEHTSFQTLYPLLRKNTLTPSQPWWRVDGFEVRDTAHVIYYGTEDDGLNLNVGVLTSQQGEDFPKALGFKTPAPKELAVSDGALLVDLDRYVKVFGRKDQFQRLLGEHEKLVKIANAMADSLLNTA